MRAALVLSLVMACRGASGGPAPEASATAVSPARATTSAATTPIAHGPAELWCKATASSCKCSDYVGGHDYALSCDRANACTCTTDGATTKTFTSSGCGVTEWQTCGYPEK